MSIAQNRKLERISEHTLVVGVDIAKKRHVARAGNFRGMELAKPLTFDNRKRGFEALMQWIQDLQRAHGLSAVIVGMEPTGHYWMNLAQYLRGQGILTVLVNPLHVKKSKELDDNSPTKHDTKDAWVIAQLVKDGRYAVPLSPTDVFAELRVGMNERERLEKDLRRAGGRIENWLDRFFPEFLDVFRQWDGKTALICLHSLPLPQDVMAKGPEQIVALWREQGVKRGVGLKRACALQEAARQSIGLTEGQSMGREELQILLQQQELLAGQLQALWGRLLCLLQGVPGAAQMLTVPGVGPVTVAGFLAEVGDLTQYAHWRQVQKLAGYNLKNNSSGEHKGQTHISKRGRPRLRALLYRCVVPMLVHNAEFRALHTYYTTRPDNPLKKKQSLVALCVKLLRVLFTLGRRQTPYDADKVTGVTGTTDKTTPVAA